MKSSPRVSPSWPSPWEGPDLLARQPAAGGRQEAGAGGTVDQGQVVEVGPQGHPCADPVARQADDLGDLPEVEGEAVPGGDPVTGVALDQGDPDDPDAVPRPGEDAVAPHAADLGRQVLGDQGRGAVGLDGRGGRREERL